MELNVVQGRWPAECQARRWSASSVTLFLFFLFKFIYFWLHWVFIASHRLPLVASGAALPCCVWASRFGGISCCWAQALGCKDLRSCSLRVLVHGAVGAGQGFLGPWHVGSSWARGGTHVLCVGRILIHRTARKVPCPSLSCDDYFLWRSGIQWMYGWLSWDCCKGNTSKPLTISQVQRQLESKALSYLEHVWKLCPMVAKCNHGCYKGLYRKPWWITETVSGSPSSLGPRTATS